MNPIQSICVYCSSSNHAPEETKQMARAIGVAVARRRLKIVYGGGRVGLMGILASAALSEGGEVVGIIPQHLRVHEAQHDGLTELHVVDSMHTRKRMMVERADAFLILPGGLGTLDEAFEILTWKHLGLHDKPIIIYNQDGYWDRLIDLIDHIIEDGFAPRESYLLYKVAHSIDELFTALAVSVGGDSPPDTKRL
ncbi:MAG: TIGR00730 family Rossman fold protein [Alphaproteobacteria bacterium]|nr:TIGR00730 family Rossman fold protein [Alphaproteobacteria bacterium]